MSRVQSLLRISFACLALAPAFITAKAHGVDAPLMAPLRVQDARADAAAIDGVLEAAIASRLTAGAVVGVLRHGQAPTVRSYGFANLEHQVPVTEETIFFAGSMAKQFTAAAVMLLAEQGRLSIDDPLSRHLPDFPRGGEVTLRQLMNHTSGLRDYLELELRERILLLVAERGIGEFADYIARMPDLYQFEPGTTWNYSNSGYVLLGAVIERASGESYSAFLHQNLLGPLGLRHTAVDDPAEIVPNRASGYVASRDAPTGFVNARDIPRNVGAPAGALRSTAADLLRFHGALFAGELLRPSSLAAMIDPAQMGDRRRTSEALPPAVEERRRGRPFPDYGLGFFIEEQDGRRALGHTGRLEGFNASVQTYPDEGVTIVILTNTLPAAQRLAPQVASALLGSPSSPVN